MLRFLRRRILLITETSSLQRFLQRIARHPILGRSEFFTMFLESPGFVRKPAYNEETVA